MKLAQEPCYHDIITPEQFQLCGLVINVSLTFVCLYRMNRNHVVSSVCVCACARETRCSASQQQVEHVSMALTVVLTLDLHVPVASPPQDECYQVRQIFAQKLHLALVKLQLPLEYLAVFALCAKDPVKERRAHARQCLLKNISVRREYIKQNPLAQGKDDDVVHRWAARCSVTVYTWRDDW